MPLVIVISPRSDAKHTSLAHRKIGTPKLILVVCNCSRDLILLKAREAIVQHHLSGEVHNVLDQVPPARRVVQRRRAVDERGNLLHRKHRAENTQNQNEGNCDRVHVEVLVPRSSVEDALDEGALDILSHCLSGKEDLDEGPHAAGPFLRDQPYAPHRAQEPRGLDHCLFGRLLTHVLGLEHLDQRGLSLKPHLLNPCFALASKKVVLFHTFTLFHIVAARLWFLFVLLVL
mmetsp:Transcript_7154/g.17439  ORF Transcript_7154/g.17439 Transcript_7154/m.17439 type:complete len:231 (+) Transcript_7154:91-783(+)